jgi:hypothetical protein
MATAEEITDTVLIENSLTGVYVLITYKECSDLQKARAVMPDPTGDFKDEITGKHTEAAIQFGYLTKDVARIEHWLDPFMYQAEVIRVMQPIEHYFIG